MPDGRFVSKSISQSEQLASVSFAADYLFGRCIPHLDRDGRITGNPVLLKSIVCPLRPEIDAGCIPELIRTLAGAGLVRWYQADGKPVLEFPGFARHQKGMKYEREAASRFPASTSDGAQDLLRTGSGPTPDEVRLSLSLSEVQVKNTEAKASGASAADSTDPWDEVDNPDPDGPPADAKDMAAQLAYFMPLLRDQLHYDLQGQQAGSIVKAILGGKTPRSPPSLDRAVRGLAWARDRGLLTEALGIGPDEPLVLTILYTAKQGTRPLWNRAVDEWWPKSLERPKKRRNDPSPVRIGIA